MKYIEVLQGIEIGLAVILALVILLQQGGGGLGNVFGGAGGEHYRSKRGAEAMLYKVTIVSIILFVINAFAIAVLSS